MNFICSLRSRQDPGVAGVGGKFANLRLLARTYRVPDAFCVTTAAFGHWRAADDRDRLPETLHREIEAAHRELASGAVSEVVAVAVRSSAVGEDGLRNSFAGQFQTYLNVADVSSVVDSILRCWRSVDSPEVRGYAAGMGLDSGSLALAVMVQRMVVADVAGVAFSANPISGEDDVIVINANWGLGASVVDGSATPDTCLVRKSDLTILETRCGGKQVMTIPKPGGIQEVAVPGLLRKRLALSREQIVEIARLTKQLEADFQRRVDIEWAIANEELFLLQCRPITRLHLQLVSGSNLGREAGAGAG